MIPVMMVCVGLCGSSGGKEEAVLRNYVRLADGELPVEDIEKFPLYSTNIALSK